MYTKDQLLSQLVPFSCAVGKPVLVHTSLRAVGPMEDGGSTLLEALIAFFTASSGLLCVPTHTWDSDTLDLRKAESCIGTLPRLAAAHPDGIRSLHPTHSIAVFGSGAAEFVKCEESITTPAGPDGCYGRLYQEDGYVLLIGVGHDKNTYLHCVEEMLQVPGRLTAETVARTIIHRDGRSEARYLRWFDEAKIPDVSVYFGKYEPAFRYHGCILDTGIGNARAQLCSARKMAQVMALIRQRSEGRELLSDHSPLPKEFYINENRK